MKVVGYAYPWDVTVPGFVERARALGVDEVAVAVAYHSARAATPWSAEGSAMLVEHAALYRPVREQAWAPGAPRPAEPEWVASRDSAGDAVRALGAAGIPAAAWIVLTHSSRVGAEFPELAVRNCFGETYPWALCPSQQAVREYAATVAAECLQGLGFSSVILEACGPLGAVHLHQHEKTDGVWAPAVARLLSICCCVACAAGWIEAGLDPATVRATLAAEVRRLVDTGDLTITADALAPALAATLLRTRHEGVDALRAAVLDRIDAGTRVVLHVGLDPWATGAFPGLTPTAADDVDAVVLFNWVPGPGSADTVAAARAQLPERVAVASYVTAVAAAAVPDIGDYVTELAKAGADELHLYHLGLAGPARWPDLQAATAAAHHGDWET
ncbi:hypothetical protein [Pseudonocardia sp. GCM10023141]|uniref:hypothetical protein n=1 Tax=Pseudonocardia sp. GCM10023141 TaxID=3252653 RepID=UPI00360CD7DF